MKIPGLEALPNLRLCRCYLALTERCISLNLLSNEQFITNHSLHFALNLLRQAYILLRDRKNDAYIDELRIMNRALGFCRLDFHRMVPLLPTYNRLSTLKSVVTLHQGHAFRERAVP